MTKFGTRMLDRTAALCVAARNVGRLAHLTNNGTNHGRAYIGFTERELKRRDVAPLIVDSQVIEEVCTEGKPFWFQARIWFEIGEEISATEWQEFIRAASARPSSPPKPSHQNSVTRNTIGD